MKVHLIISVFIGSIFFSCKTYKGGGEFFEKPEEMNLIIPYFDITGKEYLYNALIYAFGKELKGILVVRKINEEEKRVALITNFGNTLLDFRIAGDKVELMYAIDDLNKKLIIKKLKKYFHFLVNAEYDITSVYRQNNDLIYISSFQSKQIFIYKTEGQTRDSLKMAGRWKEKADLVFYGKKENVADSIRFISQEIPFGMRFWLRE